MMPIIKYIEFLGSDKSKWYVGTKENGFDACNTFGDALRYWLWHCGVSPKIAFGWFRKKKKQEKELEY